jgi:hypothetical protein
MTNEINKTSLEPLILWCKNHRGAKSEVQRALTRRGENVTWGMVSGWLHPNPDLRTVCKYPIGVAMREIYNKLKSKKRRNCGH